MNGSLKVIIAVLCCALIIGAVSAKGNAPADTGKSNPLFINLTEKDSTVVAPNGAWGWVAGGGFGKLQYKTGPSAMFVFNAAKMTPYTQYTLISYKEPWLSTNNVIGTAYSDGSGAVSIKGKYEVTTKFLCNKYPTTSEEYQVNGTKIWLVPTDNLTFDAGTAVFNDWAPKEYLFETDLVNKGCIAPEEPATCDDQNPCTTDSYDAGKGLCSHTPVICNDADPCSMDSCDAGTGTCRSVPISCDDGNALTTDTCNSGSGECIHASCDSGSTDCNNNPSDGCETNTNTDTGNCGSCGTTCSVTDGTAGCSGGECTVAQCYLGYADCNGLASDGCEINLNTNTNCGSCGTPCSVADGTASCETGQCAIASCDTGYADCNGYASDGCEANLNTNTDNCGGCGTEYACYNEHGSEACVSGSCQYSCDSGWTDCSSLSSAELGLFAAVGPCQTDLSSDVSHCGTCGTTCSDTGGMPSCDGGECSISCDTWNSDCNGDASDGCESSKNIDTDNCGYCGNQCSVTEGTAGCSGGECTVDECNFLYDDCDGIYENGCEQNTGTDTDNCGYCDITCSATDGTPACEGGQCTIGSCDPGFADCNGLASDGCEINTDSDLNNCGGCTSPGGSAPSISGFSSISPLSAVGTVCSSDNGTPLCTEGQCSISCNTGYDDCNDDVSDGCETYIAGDDPTNCGSCGNVCSSNHVTPDCITGGCSLSCETGYGDCDNDV